MGCVYQFLKFFRSPETGTQGEEIGDLITEGPIIRMLLKGHYLDGVIAELLHPRQYILAEFTERSHLRLFRAHTDVALVDQRMRTPESLVMFP